MSELIDALNQLQKEKHIEKEVIMQAIEDSLVAACNRDFGKNAIVKVNMDRDTGDISVYVEKTVVEEVEDPATEISLADAKMIRFHYEIGDVVNIEEVLSCRRLKKKKEEWYSSISHIKKKTS